MFTTSLLSLVPLSCIVVPVRDLGNKFTSFSSNMIPLQIFELPTVFHSNNTGMDFFAGFSPDNYDEIRGRSPLTKENIFRNSSMSSLKSSIAYHEKMELNNTMDIDVNINNNSPTLFYKTSQEKALQVSKVAVQQANMRNKHGNLDPSKLIPQHVLNEQLLFNPIHSQAMYIEDDMVT